MKKPNDYSLKTLKEHRAEALDMFENSEIGSEEWVMYKNDIQEIEKMIFDMYAVSFIKLPPTQ